MLIDVGHQQIENFLLAKVSFEDESKPALDEGAPV